MFGEICWRIYFVWSLFRLVSFFPKRLLDSDIEHRSFILRRQEEVQAYTYATKATGIFADCFVVGALVHPSIVLNPSRLGNLHITYSTQNRDIYVNNHMILHSHYDERPIRHPEETLEAELPMTMEKDEEADRCHTYPCAPPVDSIHAEPA